jgi:hypothetical protein
MDTTKKRLNAWKDLLMASHLRPRNRPPSKEPMMNWTMIFYILLAYACLM